MTITGMMNLTQRWNAKIDAALETAEALEASQHTPSGKLSAGALGWPLQWQVLKVLGVPPKPVDAYTRRKFKRGNDVEAWILAQLGPSRRQVALRYRDVVGVLDAVMEVEGELIPLEIKSVTNMKYKQIEKRGEPDRSHILQAGLYAVALNTPRFAIGYVASDDYRLRVFAQETAQVQPEVDAVIDRFEQQWPAIPAFAPEEPWQAKAQYATYPDWQMLTEEACETKYAAWWQAH